ncbi:c-type cytochrome [Lentisphaera profundi]|uniref:C-type cytochrome n=1 Tax=Lentisphaera profundi TaxID=1658616 RepID=A0ABY7W180_9BACT|nr:c-type cytochrome [Lentisphaera profundi]WDE99233.1 c-type cytochrome [Lentisphaera profundi]
MKKFNYLPLQTTLALLTCSMIAAPQTKSNIKPFPFADKTIDKDKAYQSQIYKEHRKDNLSLDDRFERTLFASPPYAEYVTAISADIDGTLYISQDPNGSLGHYEGLGNVITAKDTNGDGKADKFVEFIPKLTSARGGHIVAGTYYLLHPPFLTSFKDTDGDGIADKRTLLADGFGAGIEHSRGADHTTNGVRMGIDGWLYIAVGDFGLKDSKGTDGKVLRYHGGGVARVRPDGSELEMYVYNTRNQFDVAISPTLELFTRDNTNDGKGWNLRVHHQVPESDFGYPRLYQNFPDEHIASLGDYGGGSGMGVLFLDEPGFPKDVNNKLYTCDWTSGKVFSFEMEAKDATYKIKQNVFTTLTRATDLDVDGESNLYFSDWLGGKFAYAGQEKPVSRIFKAKLKGYKAPAVPDLKSANDNDLVKHLIGPSASIRLQAQQFLLQKPISKQASQLLSNAALNKKLPINSRTAALFTLKQAIGEKSHSLCQNLLADGSMREMALKALTDRKTQMANVSPDLIAEYLKDPNPKVRLQAAISLRRLNKFSPKSIEQLIDMAIQSWKVDSVGQLGTMALPHMASRTLSSLGQSHDQAWQAYLSRFKSGDLKTQKVLSYGLKTIHNPKLIDALILELASDQWNDQSRLIILDILARLSHKEADWNLVDWWGTRPYDEGPYFATKTWEYTQPIEKAIEVNFTKFKAESQLDVIEAITLNKIDTTKLQLKGVDILFAALDTSVPSQQHIKTLQLTAMDTNKAWKTRFKAAKKLAEFQEWFDPGAITFKRKKGANRKAPKLRVVNEKKIIAATELRTLSSKALITSLSKWQTESLSLSKKDNSRTQIDAMLLDYWTAPLKSKNDFENLAKTANEVDDQAATLAWKKIFFAFYRNIGEKIVANQKIIDGEIGLHNPGYYQAIADIYLLDEKFKKRAQANLTWDYAGTRKAAKAVLDMHQNVATIAKDAKKSMPLTTAGLEGAAKYAMSNKGDSVLGSKLFNKQGCIACHAVNNAALQKGPYMGTAGSQFQRDFLIESVLNPAAAIAQGFPTYQLTSKKQSNPHMGFLVDEDNTYYYLMNAAGHYEKVTKEYITGKTILKMSQMPPGLVFNLNLHEFTSIIEYLHSMK